MPEYVNKIRTTDGDLPVNYNALANLPTISNPNLLINGDFRNPVNQRGQTTYAPSKNVLVYTIDRWGIFPSLNDGSGHSITVNDGYITFANTNDSMSAYLIQHLEKPLSGTYTLSVKVRSATKAFTLAYRDNGTVYNAMTLNVGINSATIECTSLDFIRFGVSSTASADIEWVKLEVGNTPTEFSPRIYAEEVEMCKRYYNRITSHSFNMVAFTASAISGAIPFNKSMRVTPTVSIIDFRYLDHSIGSYVTPAETSVNTEYTNNSCAVIQITKNTQSTLTKGSSVQGVIHVEFDAEIY